MILENFLFTLITFKLQSSQTSYLFLHSLLLFAFVFLYESIFSLLHLIVVLLAALFNLVLLHGIDLGVLLTVLFAKVLLYNLVMASLAEDLVMSSLAEDLILVV
jgi:hypothetical protein